MQPQQYSARYLFRYAHCSVDMIASPSVDTNGTDAPTRVVYLIGAGASHACVQRVKSPYGILMKDLIQPMTDQAHQLLEHKYTSHRDLAALVNHVIVEETDFEHVITFLASSPSRHHREFAADLRLVFEHVLRDMLRKVRSQTGHNPIDLYAALFDMYNADTCPEVLQGILTTNYDPYIEEALVQAGHGPVDFGFDMSRAIATETGSGVRLLKLHGSLDWKDTWPVSVGHDGPTLWIPPGIQKEKQAYPFNILWGLARELLSCDVLRIIGCRLDANDWDLISLLFTSIHVQSPYRPYRVEVIDAPARTAALRRSFPYLDPQSILELEHIGEQLISEWLPGKRRSYETLTDTEKFEVETIARQEHNWFEIWLRHKCEYLFTEFGPLRTNAGLINTFLEN